jgi:hypothetical protein
MLPVAALLDARDADPTNGEVKEVKFVNPDQPGTQTNTDLSLQHHGSPLLSW